ncbi:MAG: M23 family metallopeptidase [Desulfotomaculaceae bacterium]|nr:M23 family metallopeptidase [Desulfotomaculaceae bacterium]
MKGTGIKPGGAFKSEDLMSTYRPPHWKKPKRAIYKNHNLFRVFAALVIMMGFLALKDTANPWGVGARENLKSVLTTEWNYQPVFERVVQYGLAIANTEWPLPSSPQPVISINGLTEMPESLQVPVSGQVVRGYGMVVDPIDNMERFHSGIDIAAPVGSPVMAVQDGTVQRLGDSPVLGKYVLIEHTGEGYFSFYGELARLIVEEGQAVQAGQVIGEVGTAGDIPGGGLHFEMRENNKLVDPLTRLQLR